TQAATYSAHPPTLRRRVAVSSVALSHDRSGPERIGSGLHSLSRHFYESLLLKSNLPVHSRELMAAIPAVRLVRQVCLIGRLCIPVSFIANCKANQAATKL